MDSSVTILRVSIDEPRNASKNQCAPADSITFASIDRPVMVRDEQVFANLLENRLVMQGDVISFDVMGGSIQFMVKLCP